MNHKKGLATRFVEILLGKRVENGWQEEEADRKLQESKDRLDRVREEVRSRLLREA